MQRLERLVVPITKDMVAQADQDVLWQEQKGVRPSTRQDSAQNNFIGSLAHQAVEVCLTTHNIPFTSTRLERYAVNDGDELDIQVFDMRIDIKGTRLPDDHFYVYAQNVNNPAKDLTHYLFVRIDREWRCAFLYGLIGLADFKKKARLIRAGTNGFNHPNFGIALYALPSVKGWVEAVQN